MTTPDIIRMQKINTGFICKLFSKIRIKWTAPYIIPDSMAETEIALKNWIIFNPRTGNTFFNIYINHRIYPIIQARQIPVRSHLTPIRKARGITTQAARRVFTVTSGRPTPLMAGESETFNNLRGTIMLNNCKGRVLIIHFSPRKTVTNSGETLDIPKKIGNPIIPITRLILKT